MSLHDERVGGRVASDVVSRSVIFDEFDFICYLSL